MPSLSSLGSHARQSFTVSSNIVITTGVQRVKLMHPLSHMNHPAGRKVSSQEMERLNLKRNKFAREWNSVIRAREKY